MTAAKGNRYGHRDATMVLLPIAMGCALASWSTLSGRRSTSKPPCCMSAAPRRARPPRTRSGATSCGRCASYSARARRRPSCSSASAASPFSTAGFAKMIERAGVEAGFDFKAHPHMLRHACGFALANAGHDTRACRRTSVTATFSTRFGTPSWRRTGSRISGEIESAETKGSRTAWARAPAKARCGKQGRRSAALEAVD